MTNTQRSVNFSDDIIEIPDDILDPYYQPFTSPEQDAFCQSLGICSATLQRCARVLQKFARENTPYWTYFNNEKSRLVEDMDDVLVVKQGELERVADGMEELRREAKMEVAMEFGDETVTAEDDWKFKVETQKREVKELEGQNALLKKECDDYKSKNKKIAMDTFAMYETFSKAAYESKGLRAEQQRLRKICDKYAECVQALKVMVDTVQDDIQNERREREKLEECIDKVIELLEEHDSKRKLIEKLKKIKSAASSQLEASRLPIEV